MNIKTSLPALLAALALGLSACGGDDDKKDEPAAKDTTEQTTSTATTDAQGDPAAKAELQAAVGRYNRGYDTFFKGLRDNGGDLDELKATIADYRTVIFEFDRDLRAIEFEDELVPQVNSILENNRGLITQLDAIADARSFDDAIALYEEFGKDRGPTIKAINNLLDQL
jgi:hypothetical protein